MARQPNPTTTEPPARISKIDILVDLLSRQEGADLAALIAATGWQAHSVRGAMSGTLKTRRGLAITSEKTTHGRIYRIVQA